VSCGPVNNPTQAKVGLEWATCRPAGLDQCLGIFPALPCWASMFRPSGCFDHSDESRAYDRAIGSPSREREENERTDRECNETSG
jgi:hypothetical protein